MKSFILAMFIAITLLFVSVTSFAQKALTMTGVFKQHEGMVQFKSNQHPNTIYIPVASVQDPADVLGIEVQITATIDESFTETGSGDNVKQIKITKFEILQDMSGTPTPLPVEPTPSGAQ
ncbi:hypothetical protein [Desulfovibrio inopinatus]|uniref:hypothetical protein n=1 Tax=Desulfovibrio inopinatus TaxID=102109 RepID=UPI00040B0F45|nr:hypothetical protein [Desulfovibrio inopinatus]